MNEQNSRDCRMSAVRQGSVEIPRGIGVLADASARSVEVCASVIVWTGRPLADNTFIVVITASRRHHVDLSARRTKTLNVML